MRLLRMEEHVRPRGLTHNDAAHIHVARQMLGLEPDWLPTRTVIYGMETKRWRVDWYDLFTQRLGKPEFNRKDRP